MTVIESGEIAHLRAALDKLDELEAIVDDGCWNEYTEKLIGRLRKQFESELGRLEREALAALTSV